MEVLYAILQAARRLATRCPTAFGRIERRSSTQFPHSSYFGPIWEEACDEVCPPEWRYSKEDQACAYCIFGVYREKDNARVVGMQIINEHWTEANVPVAHEFALQCLMVQPLDEVRNPEDLKPIAIRVLPASKCIYLWIGDGFIEFREVNGRYIKSHRVKTSCEGDAPSCGLSEAPTVGDSPKTDSPGAESPAEVPADLLADPYEGIESPIEQVADPFDPTKINTGT
jgi:hypothetical protein